MESEVGFLINSIYGHLNQTIQINNFLIYLFFTKSNILFLRRYKMAAGSLPAAHSVHVYSREAFLQQVQVYVRVPLKQMQHLVTIPAEKEKSPFYYYHKKKSSIYYRNKKKSPYYYYHNKKFIIFQREL